MARARNFVEVELAETGVRVIGVHLSAGLSGRGERRRLPEIDRVLQVADAPPGAGRTLIAGDLNAVAPGDLSAVARLPAWIRLLLRVDGGIGTTVVARVLGEGYTDAYRRLNPDVVGPDDAGGGPERPPRLPDARRRTSRRRWWPAAHGGLEPSLLWAASDHLPLVVDLDLSGT